MNNKIILSKEKKEKMIAAIIDYFAKERDEEIGYLAATLILDFITEKLGPEFYNQGVYDSYRRMSEMVEDLLEIQKY
ncbi:DUF2164 domain-containing protein [Proteiniborus sp.]|uniref:DUF2164 domain-containing protein n=1 Tax=Proteiniborus sp. TaxID=2079015 RepID=UPI003331D282